MKNEAVLREAFLTNTIRLIGECGFEKATTNAIAHDGIQIPGISTNEVYIYRLFGSKVHLYEEAFASLDNELFSHLHDLLRTWDREGKTMEENFQTIFRSVWRFLLGHEHRCRCYIRFYYSAYFQGEPLRRHRKRLNEQRAYFAPVFKEESDVIAIVHTVFMSMLDFANRVFNHDIEDNEENAYHIFLLLFSSLTPYLRTEQAGA